MGFYSDYLYENAITWTTDGANAGTVRYRPEKFYCTNVCGVLLSEYGYANKAVSEVLNLVAWKYVSHVGNPKLMNNVMSDIEIVIPKFIKEQESISKYFSNLDRLITLHQRKDFWFKNVGILIETAISAENSTLKVHFECLYGTLLRGGL